MKLSYRSLQNHIIFFLWFRKSLVRLFDKVNSGLLKEGKKLSERILDMHRKRYQNKRLMNIIWVLKDNYLCLLFYLWSCLALQTRLSTETKRSSLGNKGQRQVSVRRGVLWESSSRLPVSTRVSRQRWFSSASKPWSWSSLCSTLQEQLPVHSFFRLQFLCKYL